MEVELPLAQCRCGPVIEKLTGTEGVPPMTHFAVSHHGFFRGMEAGPVAVGRLKCFGVEGGWRIDALANLGSNNVQRKLKNYTR